MNTIYKETLQQIEPYKDKVYFQGLTEAEEISSANVHCYLTKVKLDNTEIKLKRQEYEGWNSPIYYFNFERTC